ncbi:MAG: heme b synthase [Planctomycetes bacterium DG_58]|nr:MAG: heme b synthase [Planctomycetes bacterium DG_58]KPL00392.1 MAG: heme b synthase [Planctomycetes bacterium SM23_65]
MHLPRLIAVEVTRRCNLHCIHCRALAGAEAPEDELTSDEITAFFDRIAERLRPIIILTGGEPLLREDIFEIARHGTELGFHMTMAPNGTLMDETVARRMIEVGIRRVGISLDAATPEVHDAFRDMPGAFAGAMKGIDAARAAGLPFQIHTSVTAFNVDELEKVHELAKELGAVAHHIFMLVRVGRGRELDAEVPPERQEKVLNWLYERHREGLIGVRATCAPHYYRILTKRGGEEGAETFTRGCLAGRGYVFLSSTGSIQPCGYLDIDCGSIRENDFWEIWDTSPVLQNLRDDEKLRGKCGTCDYRKYCGGCRARAYAATGDYLAEEPACLYQPRGST